MSSEFSTSVRDFLDLVLVGLGFLTGSDVKDVEVEVVCASFLNTILKIFDMVFLNHLHVVLED